MNLHIYHGRDGVDQETASLAFSGLIVWKGEKQMNGIFDSNVAGTPAVSAAGTNGADGVDATSDSGVAISGTSTGGTGVLAQSPNTAAMRALSGDPNAHTSIAIGRTADEGRIGVAAAPGQYANDAVAGDIVLRTETPSQHLLLGNGPGNSAIAISNENVGIGTTTPGSKLEVIGDIGSDGVRVTSTNGDGIQVTSTNGAGLHAVAGDATFTLPSPLAAIVAEGGNFTGIQAAGAGGITPTQPSLSPVEGAVVAYGSPGIFAQNNTPSGLGLTMHVVGGGTSPSEPPRLAGNAALFVESDFVGSNGSTGIVSQSPGVGVLGMCTSATGDGVFGFSQDGTGIRGESQNGNAGVFDGSVIVTRNLLKLGGGFLIDHPTAPEHKSLFHSFVESPDMKNIYDGVVVLDVQGEAEVTLPSWFDALNTDFRYQLTAIGAAGPDLYIAEEISANRFKIAGGKPHMKVSWQVTGIRQDAWAKANRLPVEQDKPEHGYYLHPELYGESEQKKISLVHYPELKQRS